MISTLLPRLLDSFNANLTGCALHNATPTTFRGIILLCRNTPSSYRFTTKKSTLPHSTTVYRRRWSIVGESFELVFVDDGSRDRTFRLLEEIAAVDSRVLVIKLRRNFGQTSALAAGFDHSQGEFILAMDGDLQHDPDEIPGFLAKLEEGYDVVSGRGAATGPTTLSCGGFRRVARTG